jgi:hypothetical protein
MKIMKQELSIAGLNSVKEYYSERCFALLKLYAEELKNFETVSQALRLELPIKKEEVL